MPEITWEQIAKSLELQRKLVVAAKEGFDDAKQARAPHERQWWKNLAFHGDQQWVRWSKSKGALEAVAARRGEDRITNNIIKPAVNTAQDSLARNEIRLVGVPYNQTPAALESARSATHELQYQWHRQEMADKDPRFVGWTAICGTGVLGTGWDPEAWAELEDGVHQIGAQQTEVVPIFEFFPEPASLDMKEMPWAIRATWRPLSYIQQRWPETGKDIKGGTATVTENMIEGLVLQELVGGDRTWAATKAKGAVVIELFAKPANHPIPMGRGDFCLPKEGALLRICEDTLLDAQPSPYKELPFAVAIYEEMPNVFWGRGIPQSMIPLQYNLNLALSRVVQAVKYCGNPTLLVQTGSQLAKEKYWTNLAGQIVETPGGAAVDPHFMLPAQMPSFVDNLIIYLPNAAKDVEGHHEVSNATAPTGVSSGKAILALQYADDRRRGPAKRSLNQAYLRWGRAQLEMAERFYAEGENRRAAIPGDEKNPVREGIHTRDTFSLTNSLKVQSDAGIPDNIEGKRDLVLTLANQGWLGDPQDPATKARVLKMFELGADAEEITHEMAEGQEQQAVMQQMAARIQELEAALGAQGGAPPGPGPPLPGAGPPGPPGPAPQTPLPSAASPPGAF